MGHYSSKSFKNSGSGQEWLQDLGREEIAGAVCSVKIPQVDLGLEHPCPFDECFVKVKVIVIVIQSCLTL